MNFTLKTYRLLLKELKKQDYSFQNLLDFYLNPKSKVVILRHDVDRKPLQALKMAKIEKDERIAATYYFRCKNCSWNTRIVREIHALKHEIGYHYENMRDSNGDFEKAIEDFKLNLTEFQKTVPIKTICMHGSPLSKHDNRLLWKKYNYKDYNITMEPYFDMDYNKVFYITDTGRKWNSENISFRDKVNSTYNIKIDNTKHLLKLIRSGGLPDTIMINTHPHRWFNFGIKWINEYLFQNIKNIIKRYLININHRRS